MAFALMDSNLFTDVRQSHLEVVAFPQTEENPGRLLHAGTKGL